MNKFLLLLLSFFIFSAFANLSYAQAPKPSATHIPLPRSKQPLSAEMIKKLHALPTLTNADARPRAARMTSLVVTLSTDNNPGGIGDPGDLRYAINSMNQLLSTTPDDFEITFAFPMTIQLNGILPIINNSSNPVNITIGNPGTTATVTIDGNSGSYPGFFIPMGNVTIQNIIFQNLSAKGGNGGDGISGGGGGLGAGAGIFAPQTFLNGSNPTISLIEVTISNSSAVGGNGGNYFSIPSPTGNEGAGGGGGFWGNGGSVLVNDMTGGGGGGGFGGDGGNVTSGLSNMDGGAGGGGGGLGSRATIGVLTNLGHGGSDVTAGLDGNGYGLSITAGTGAGGYSGGINAGGGGGGSDPSGFNSGGGGGGSMGANGNHGQGSTPPIIVPYDFPVVNVNRNAQPSGGSGGDGAGGGGGGIVITNFSNNVDGSSGAGGYGGGGGGAAGTGAYDADYFVFGGLGGMGGGGGGGGGNQSGITLADGGNSLGGGGGAGGGPSQGAISQGGIDIGHLGGGAGGVGSSNYGPGFGGGGGGGGSGLGAAVFVDSNLNFILQAKAGVPTTFNTPNNTVQAGVRGLAGSGGGTDGMDGSALGNSIFLRTGSSLTFMAQGVNDILTLGADVGFVDDTSFGMGGTSVMVRGNGTVVYNGTSNYDGTVLINNANLKVNGQINQASVFVCRNSGLSSQRGKLSGGGTVSGNVFANSGTISPGAGATLTVGSLTLNSADSGNGTLGSAVAIDINGGGTSLIAVTGAASLAGVLQLNIDPSVTSGTYTILTSAGITNTFDSVAFTGSTPGSYTVSYLPQGAPTYVQVEFGPAAAAPKVTGTGTLAGSVTFKLSATKNSGNKIVASMFYNDTVAEVHFDNPVITGLNFVGNQTTMTGKVKVLGKHPGNVNLTVVTTDNTSPTPDTLSITLSNGYTKSGNLTSGDISNQ